MQEVRHQGCVCLCSALLGQKFCQADVAVNLLCNHAIWHHSGKDTALILILLQCTDACPAYKYWNFCINAVLDFLHALHTSILPTSSRLIARGSMRSRQDKICLLSVQIVYFNPLIVRKPPCSAHLTHNCHEHQHSLSEGCWVAARLRRQCMSITLKCRTCLTGGACNPGGCSLQDCLS